MASEMQLADVVRMDHSDHEQELRPYADYTVKQVRDGWITMMRIYVKTEDWSYTSGVICYVGIEEFEVSQSSSIKWTLLSRKVLH